MEISNPLQADILHIQEQLKAAIHNHQLLVLELKLDSENAELKKKLGDLQRYIMFLGLSQKRLLQELREQLQSGSCKDLSQLQLAKQSDESCDKSESPNTETLNKYINSGDDCVAEKENKKNFIHDKEMNEEVTKIPRKIETTQKNNVDIVCIDELPIDKLATREDKDDCFFDDEDINGKEEVMDTSLSSSVNGITPCKRARLGITPDNSSLGSRSSTPELAPSPRSSERTPRSSPRSSPVTSESKPIPFQSSLLTRSSRLLADSLEPRIPSPIQSRSESPNLLELCNGDLDAALDPQGTPIERQIRFLMCLGLVKLKIAEEILSLQNQRKLKPSAMNPFIMLTGLDPSQKRRRETYLQSHSPHKSRNSDDSSPERDSSPCPSESRHGLSETPFGSESGEHDQLFTEHQLDTLAEQHPFLLEEIALDQQVLVSERDRLRDLHHQLSHEQEMLEERKEDLENAIQEQDLRIEELLEEEKRVRLAIERVHNFIALFQDTPSLE